VENYIHVEKDLKIVRDFTIPLPRSATGDLQLLACSWASESRTDYSARHPPNTLAADVDAPEGLTEMLRGEKGIGACRPSTSNYTVLLREIS
jgi:hypothetical protein